MRRRAFISLLGGAAVPNAWALAARAQKSTTPAVGYLAVGSREGTEHLAAAVRKGLAQQGYVAGRNVTIEYRWGDGRIEPLPALAAELVRRRVDLIVAVPSPAAHAAKAATATTPIIFTSGIDPVKAGLVESLSRPGGNLTGFSSFNHTLDTKKLEFIRTLVPRGGTVALLVNSASPAAESWVPEMQRAARGLGQELRVVNANSIDEIDAAFAELGRLRPAAILVGGGALYLSSRHRIVSLVASMGIPAIYPAQAYAAAGGLLSYAASQPDIYRQVGVYAGRILKGERPANLPIVQPSRFEFVINLRTAKALGLTIPPTLLALADEVIE